MPYHHITQIPISFQLFQHTNLNLNSCIKNPIILISLKLNKCRQRQSKMPWKSQLPDNDNISYRYQFLLNSRQKRNPEVDDIKRTDWLKCPSKSNKTKDWLQKSNKSTLPPYMHSIRIPIPIPAFLETHSFSPLFPAAWNAKVQCMKKQSMQSLINISYGIYSSFSPTPFKC